MRKLFTPTTAPASSRPSRHQPLRCHFAGPFPEGLRRHGSAPDRPRRGSQDAGDFVSGTLGEELAVKAVKSGASDYIPKTKLSQLAPAIRRALREARERRAGSPAGTAAATGDAVIGQKHRMASSPHWNAGAETLFGYRAAEACGHSIHDAHAAGSRQARGTAASSKGSAAANSPSRLEHRSCPKGQLPVPYYIDDFPPGSQRGRRDHRRLAESRVKSPPARTPLNRPAPRKSSTPPRCFSNPRPPSFTTTRNSPSCPSMRPPCAITASPARNLRP